MSVTVHEHTQNTNLINKKHGKEFIKKQIYLLANIHIIKIKGLLKLVINYGIKPLKLWSLKLY